MFGDVNWRAACAATNKPRRLSATCRERVTSLGQNTPSTIDDTHQFGLTRHMQQIERFRIVFEPPRAGWLGITLELDDARIQLCVSYSAMALAISFKLPRHSPSDAA